MLLSFLILYERYESLLYKVQYHQLMIWRDRFMSTTDGLFLVTPDSKIAMTSKLIFFDGKKSLKSSNIFEREHVFR